jgi:hypothetical protein
MKVNEMIEFKNIENFNLILDKKYISGFIKQLKLWTIKKEIKL